MAVFLPRSLEEAFEMLEGAPETQLLAGGTDFMVEVNAGQRRPSSVLYLGHLGELAGWRREGEEVVLGAGLTYREMMDRSLGRLLPALAQAARTVGSPQIRNAGTLGGNLGTASPAGDTLPVLAASQASIVVGGPGGARRSVGLEELVTGPKATSLRAGEIIVEVRLPAGSGAQEFLKVGTRNAMVIAVASVALAVDWAHRAVRLALGAVGPTVIRAREAEELAASHIAWEERRLVTPARWLEEFTSLVRGAARPIDDHRSTAAYRRHAVGVCAERALRRAVGAGEPGADRSEEPWAS